ncbi:MAG TPA: LysM peptidoglycan-binding domain-containing M23 family metallopeptidase [Xanthobacteraceae bacterium]|nr:LysM peptidoglycan-binding domain-containing M23 family metallopeptidase [Xanthobacteraceae bacterium]
MCASRRSAVWPQVLAVALMGLGAAGCTDSSRFAEFDSERPRGEVTGSVPQPGNRVESRALPRLGDGVSGGGRGMGSYQPGNGDVTGALPPSAPPPPPRFTWEGGTPITVAPGETLETIARRYDVPVAALMEANNITRPGGVHPGQHLVIPRRRGPATALAAPPTRVASSAAAMPSPAPVGPPRNALAAGASVHVVAPGETLHSIARHYGKPVLVLAKANNIAPDSMVRVGERITIPGGASTAVAAAAAPAAPAPRNEPPVGSLAAAESPQSARLAAAVVPDAEEGGAKAGEAGGSVPGFRWPVRGRVIAGFGPKPNGLQNDGINLAVPEGTPVKAADDGVVAYAGNELKGYGNLVLVRHSNGFVTAYAHASEIMVKRGDSVKRGQVIAKSGQTGSVTSPQLHFEIRKGATPVDPSQYLNGA